jgi:hypothetical protein
MKMLSTVRRPGPIAAALLLCALSATAAAAHTVKAEGRQAPALAAKTGAAKKTTARSHTISGVVKSIDDKMLVISRTGKKSDMTFALDSSTGRGGTINVGTPVSVRYRMQGKSRSALFITAKNEKQQASKK